jgi:hypothetical protein
MTFTSFNHIYHYNLLEIFRMDFKIEMALGFLNTLILEKSWEFPEALRRTLHQFAVSQAELTKAYDQQ